MRKHSTPGTEAAFNAEFEEQVRVWRSRVQIAKARYELASARMAEATAERHLIPPPDGNMAYLDAIRAEGAARKEYMRALRICHRLLLDHAVSPDQNFGDPEDRSQFSE